MDNSFYDDSGFGLELSQTLFDAYRGSFWSIGADGVPGLAYLDVGDSDLMNLATTQIQQQFYQRAVSVGWQNEGIEQTDEQMNIRQVVFSQGFTQESQVEEFFPYERSQPSSSLSSFSEGSPEYSSLLPSKKVPASFMLDPSKQPATKLAAQPTPAVLPPRQVAMQAYRFPTLEDDDEAITRAMMAVISSSSPSSSSSSPPIISHTTQEAQIIQAHAHGQLLGAFKPYNSALAPQLEPKKESCGQKMIKNSISILKRTNWGNAEVRPQESRQTSSNQLHHVISERRRREKLNESFRELRMLLPPGSKTDKASVLTHARNYLNTLKAQIYELEEKSRKLELQLLPTDETEETTGSSGRVKVQIIKASEQASELQRINLRLTVKAESDVIALVLHVLECLKAMGLTSLASVDAYTYSLQMNLFARVDIKLHIKACDWNEASFKEAMTMAVDGMTATA